MLLRDAKEAGRVIVTPAYSEVGSASRFGDRERAEFARLLADLASGEFGADVLGVWETSRSTRQMEQSLPLVNALRDAGVLLWVHSLGRLFDPRKAHDRADLLSAAVKDELASAETSDRVLRDVAAQAVEGAPHGMAPFGYRHDYDPDTGALIGRVVVEPSAAVVREVFDRTRAGESTKTIARDFAVRGICRPDRTTSKGRVIPGGPYSPQQLGSWLRNPAYAGVRVHMVGRKGQHTLTADAQRYAAQWPAIVEQDVWDDVAAVLADPGRLKNRPGRARHLLGGIARCARCGSKVQRGRSRRDIEIYRCQDRGCCATPKADLDALALKVVATFIGGREYAALVQPGETTTAELAEARHALAEAVAELAELRAAARLRPGTPGRISVATVAALEPDLQKHITEAQATVNRLSAPKLPAGVIEPGADAAERLAAAPFEAQRRTMTALLVPEFVGSLLLLPVAEGWDMYNGPARSRAVFWRGRDAFAGAVSQPVTKP